MTVKRMDPELLRQFSQKLVDEGKIIAAGFEVVKNTLGQGLPAAEIGRLQLAYFAGAQHVFSSIITMFEDGDGATEKDIERLTKMGMEIETINEVLEKHAADWAAKRAGEAH